MQSVKVLTHVKWLLQELPPCTLKAIISNGLCLSWTKIPCLEKKSGHSIHFNVQSLVLLLHKTLLCPGEMAKKYTTNEAKEAKYLETQHYCFHVKALQMFL